MIKINRIKLFVNDNLKSKKISDIVKSKLKEKGFKIVAKNYDLGIAIGGDGAFLRMIKASDFDSKCYYIGINTGTLGFAMELSFDDIDKFIEKLTLEELKCEKIGIGEIEISTKESTFKHFTLNEIVLREQELNTAKFKVLINDELLENYVGDGLLISTSFGSTPYNLSFGGSIVYNTFHTLQLTPIAPLNSKSYRNLLNSLIVPGNKTISIRPEVISKNILVSIDGDNYKYDNVISIDTYIENKEINILRMKDYDMIKKINEKFLK